MYLRSIALAVLFLQVINEAHSIKCYECKGDLSSDCETNPNDKLLKDCTVDKMQFDIRENDTLSCVTLYETINGEKKVERYPALDRWTCDKLAKHVKEETGGQVDSCERCDRDGCNAPAPRTTTANETQSPLKCYQCSGEFNGECHRYPEQKKFETVCSDMDALSSYFHSIAAFNESSYFHCLTYETTARGVVRSCAPKSFDCDILMTSRRGASSTNCRTCDVDLCNSSSSLQVAISSLLSCIFVIIFLSKQQ